MAPAENVSHLSQLAGALVVQENSLGGFRSQVPAQLLRALSHKSMNRFLTCHLRFSKRVLDVLAQMGSFSLWSCPQDQVPPLGHPWMRPAGPMGVGNLGCCDPSGSKMLKGFLLGNEAGPSSSQTSHECLSSPSHAAVSLHPGSIKLKGSDRWACYQTAASRSGSQSLLHILPSCNIFAMHSGDRTSYHLGAPVDVNETAETAQTTLQTLRDGGKFSAPKKTQPLPWLSFVKKKH